jgi:hypothetical protein
LLTASAMGAGVTVRRDQVEGTVREGTVMLRYSAARCEGLWQLF